MEIDQQINFINTHDVSGIVGLPSQIHARTHRFVEAGYDPSTFGIDALYLGGEAIGAARRAQLEEFYDADVHTFIATSESMVHSAECRQDHGHHIMEDRVHVEILDENGTPVQPGEQGRMTVTNLLAPGEESSMPLIRYQPGDITKEIVSDCGCSWSHSTRVEQPHRAGWEFNFGAVVLDVLYFEDVIYQHPAIEDEVTDFQLYLDRDGVHEKDRLEVRIVTRSDAHEAETVENVTIGETSNAASKVGQSLLTKRSTVEETVDIVDAAQIDVQFVADINHSRGKPDRLVDDR